MLLAVYMEICVPHRYISCSGMAIELVVPLFRFLFQIHDIMTTTDSLLLRFMYDSKSVVYVLVLSHQQSIKIRQWSKIGYSLHLDRPLNHLVLQALRKWSSLPTAFNKKNVVSATFYVPHFPHPFTSQSIYIHIQKNVNGYLYDTYNLKFSTGRWNIERAFV